MFVVNILILLLSFILLAVICEDFFVPALDKIADRYSMRSEVAGATLMAMGSSAPEFFTAFFAVVLGGGVHADIGSGTIVGSALFNILVIIGVSAMFRRAELTWQPVIRDLIFYSLSILVLLLTFRDGSISFNEALLFVWLYGVYVYMVMNWGKWFSYEDTGVHREQKENKDNSQKNVISRFLAKIIPNPNHGEQYFYTFGISIVLLGVLSYVLVESAIYLSYVLNISEAIIALTVLAMGTSVPDLFSSIIVAKEGRGDMAISNAVGSNIFDILFGLGVPWLLLLGAQGGFVGVSTENLMSSVFLLFATVLAVLFVLIMRKWKIGHRAGFGLVAVYIVYLVYNIVQIV